MKARKMDRQMKQLSSNELEAQIKRLQKELEKRRREEAVSFSLKKKQEQRRLRRQQQEETDEVYNLTDLFDNQTRYTDEYFTNAVNDIRSLLNQNLVVEINGRIVKPDGSAIEEYKTTFYTRDQFESYLSKLQETSDTDEWKFTGTVKIVETNIRFNKNRSRAGMGTNYLYQIKEYEGTNCYIPSDGRCFIKCFKKLYPLITDADQMFDNFLFNDNRKDRKGIMTNARFGQFNKKLESHYRCLLI